METSFLAYVRGRCRTLPTRDVVLGIGDDAAVYTPAGPQVICTDQIIDAVDFEYRPEIAEDIGYKSVAINLSDIAAMGATPRHMLVTLSLPVGDAIDIAAGVYDGIIAAASQFGVSIIGGDISTYDGPLAISVTVTGDLPTGQSAWTRRGGDVDQAVYVTGPVGGSILGRHLRPTPRVSLAAMLRDLVDVTAAIDISDGLSLDLDRLLAASGVGVLLDPSAIPIHDDAVRLSEQSGQTPFRHAWSDGEDFELIFTVDSNDAATIESHDWTATGHDKPIRIGTTTSRMGLWQNTDGHQTRLSPQGYVHGRP